MKSRVLLFLFALPFFSVGAWMGYSIASSLFEVQQMKAWEPVPATLTRAGYETHSGDDSDTYEAFAEYAYTWEGEHYRGDRVSVSGGSDNIGDYQQDMGNRLRAAMNRGETITVWVDPEAPGKSVIDPELRWGLMGFKSIFLLVFGGAGLGMIIWAIRAPGEADTDRPEFADAPWLANDAWQSPEIKSGSRTSMWGAWGFAVFWNLISAPLPFLLYREVLEKGNMLALVGLLFPLVGFGLLWWAISRSLEWRRFGPAPVTLDPFPGSIGGHVGGTIDIRLPFRPGTRFSLTLTSIRSYESGSGKDRSTKERAEWQDSQLAHATAGPSGTRIVFRFDVPEGLAPSDAEQGGDSFHLWRLNLKAELDGTDLDRDYNIPVYATATESARLGGLSLETAKSAQQEADLEAIRKLVSIRQGVEGKSILYPMGRHRYNGLVGMVIGLIFAGAGWFLITAENHWLMGGVFFLVGAAILLSGFYYLANSLEVVKTAGDIRTVRRVLGVPVGRRMMNVADFTGFSRKSTLQTQSGSRHVVYYKLLARRRGGPDLVLGEGFRGASQVDAAEVFLARELGLEFRRPAVPDPANPADGYNVLAAD